MAVGQGDAADAGNLLLLKAPAVEALAVKVLTALLGASSAWRRLKAWPTQKDHTGHHAVIWKARAGSS